MSRQRGGSVRYPQSAAPEIAGVNTFCIEMSPPPTMKIIISSYSTDVVPVAAPESVGEAAGGEILMRAISGERA